jgi:hypothetical protein
VNTPAQRELRTCAFGDLDTGLWGLVWTTAGDGPVVSHLDGPGGIGPVLTDAVSFETSGLGEQSTLRGEGIELELSAVGEPARIALPEYDIEMGTQLCRAHGSRSLDGIEREIDCFGQLGTRSWPSDPERLESLREVLAWFGPGDGVALISLRSPHSDGHDRDVVAGVLFQEGSPVDIAEPRLSTTYIAEGRPARASLELWLDEPDAEPPERDPADADANHAVAPHFPRRAAGEATGATVELAIAALDLQAAMFEWHMSGRGGPGVYLLARPA